MSTVQTTTRRRPAAKAAAKFKVDLGGFPPLPTNEQDGLTFWLVCWRRSTVKREKLRAFLTTSPAAVSAAGLDYVLSLSISSALKMMKSHEAEDLRQLVAMGGLLFAWEGTTKGGGA